MNLAEANDESPQCGNQKTKAAIEENEDEEATFLKRV